MKTPPIVSAQEWDAALQEMLVKEKEVQRARDALAAQRRRMPWTAVEKEYVFDGPDGKVSLLDLFDGRRQLIIYRAFIEPGVRRLARTRMRGLLLDGRPCAQPGPSQRTRHHVRLRLARIPARTRADESEDGWRHPWFTITDDFDKDFGCDEWHATNAFIRDENDRVFRTYCITGRGDEVFVNTWNFLDMTALGRQEDWEDSPEGYPQSPPYEWWIWHDTGETEDDVPTASACLKSAPRPARSQGPGRCTPTIAVCRRFRMPYLREGTGDHDVGPDRAK